MHSQDCLHRLREIIFSWNHNYWLYCHRDIFICNSMTVWGNCIEIHHVNDFLYRKKSQYLFLFLLRRRQTLPHFSKGCICDLLFYLVSPENQPAHVENRVFVKVKTVYTKGKVWCSSTIMTPICEKQSLIHL